MNAEVVGTGEPESFEYEPLRYPGYAGFWSRLVANLVDALAMLPLSYAVYGSRSQQAYVLGSVPLAIISIAYPIVMHARYGQTLGKMVARIRVVTVEGEPIGLRHALARSSVDLALTLVAQVAWFSTVPLVPAAAWNLGFQQLWETIRGLEPAWGRWASVLGTLWFNSEIIVMLSNRKRRALHDFIAGTVVVNMPRKAEQAHSEP